MANIVTQEFYNGSEWIRVTAEVLYNAKGEPTGHYKELTREFVSKSGIFDSLKERDAFIDLVKDYRRTWMDSYYLLQYENEAQLFQSYTSNSEYASLGHAVLSYLISAEMQMNEILFLSYERVNEGKDEDFIELKAYKRGSPDDIILFSFRKTNDTKIQAP